MRRYNNKRPVSSKRIELADDAPQPKAAATPAETTLDPLTESLSRLARLLARQAARECVQAGSANLASRRRATHYQD
jgi:hypothetical protein